MNKQVLLINDLAGYGKVALSVMIPVMSKMGVNVQNLPTALVSNTLDYGKFDILDTTDYMKNSLKIWDELGFSFDGIATGFIVNSRQAELVREYCLQQSAKGSLILCDPIMGDDGSLYPGMGEDTVDNMRGLVSCADYVVPNYTEAVFLTGHEYKENPTDDEIKEIICDLRKLGAKSAAITSCKSCGVHKVCCYDDREKRFFSVPFDNIPVRFPGTGDIFSSLMLGSVINGESMEKSVEKAVRLVRVLIEKNLSNDDKLRGIDIETYLEEI